MKRGLIIIVLLAAFCPCDVVRAEDLLGRIHNWGGLRDSLKDKGLSFDVVYTGDFAANTQGGLKREATYLSNLDVAMTLDTAKAGLWDNGRIFVYGLVNHDEGKPSAEFVGDRQAVDNIEAPRTGRLFEAWYEHQLLEEQLSVLFGVHDYNSEFDVSDYAGLFINSSFGIQPDISANGRPSVFPLAAPAVRLKWAPQEAWEFLLGVYDGNLGDPGVERHANRWDFSKEQGVFIAGEVMRRHSIGEDLLPGFLKFGTWQNTGNFTDVLETDPNGNPVIHDGNYGFYAIVDQMLYKEHDEQGLGAFVQIGAVPEDRNEIGSYIGGGFNYRGLIPGRDQDEAGFAVARVGISDDFRQAQESRSAETALEWTYKARICDNFNVQPDVQYVINPGANPELDNALVTILRFEIII